MRDAIVCIGWGSLINEPGGLPCGPWQNDGPALPVEFARESGVKPGQRGDRITLVICPGVPLIGTSWSALDVPDLDAARMSLATREGVVQNMAEDIGWWDGDSARSHGLEAATIAAWATAKGLRGAVWTNLPCGFKGKRGAMPDGTEVVAFLRALGPGKHGKAEHYVRTAPAQTDTVYRRLIERELGWTRQV